MTHRTLLNDLLAEIDAVKEYTEPSEEVRPSDTVFSSDCPEDIKKLWTLRQKYGMEATKLDLMAAMFGSKNEDIAASRLIYFKATVLTELLWQTLSMQFPAEKQLVVGIRKGWVLVNPDPNYTPLQDLIEEPTPAPGMVN